LQKVWQNVRPLKMKKVMMEQAMMIKKRKHPVLKPKRKPKVVVDVVVVVV
jgi:hypothetical protein